MALLIKTELGLFFLSRLKLFELGSIKKHLNPISSSKNLLFEYLTPSKPPISINIPFLINRELNISLKI